MGYDSRLYIVEESNFVFPSDNGKRFAEVIGMVELCVCYEIKDVFDEDANGYIYSDDVEINIDVIRTMMNEDNPYNDVQRIFISKQEMDTITSMPYPYAWKKVLFTILVHYKVKLQVYPEARNKRIEANLTYILNDAHVTLSKDKKIEMLAKFEEDGLIEMPNGGKQAKYFYLYYIDDNPEEIAITVEDFFDFYLYYEQYVKGGRLIYCSECGKLVLLTSVNDGSTKYCKKCKREKDLERQEKYNLKRENRTK